MAKVQVTIKSVRLYENNIELTFSERIDGYAENKETGIYEPAQVDHFSVNRSAFTAQICELGGNDSDLVADYRATRETAFDQAALGKIFTRGTVFIVERTHHTAGEELTDEKGEVLKNDDGNPIVYKRDCFTTTIVGLKLTDNGRKRLENALVL